MKMSDVRWRVRAEEIVAEARREHAEAAARVEEDRRRLLNRRSEAARLFSLAGDAHALNLPERAAAYRTAAEQAARQEFLRLQGRSALAGLRNPCGRVHP